MNCFPAKQISLLPNITTASEKWQRILFAVALTAILMVFLDIKVLRHDNAILQAQPAQKTLNAHHLARNIYTDGDSDNTNDYSEKESVYHNSIRSTIHVQNQVTRDMTSLHRPFKVHAIRNIYPEKPGGVTDRLILSTDSRYFLHLNSENPFSWTKTLIPALLFLFVYGIIMLIQNLQRRRMVKKRKIEHHMTELQYNIIKNQLNPHFIFNTLNSIGYMIENSRKDEAYHFLTLNARLIRKILIDADISTRSLQEEIEFTKDYLSVQKFRFKNRFDYSIDIDPMTNMELPVPKMVIHTYAENAVKHGFSLAVKGGVLKVGIISRPNGVKIVISDNGPGKPVQNENPDNTGRGLDIMNRYYRLFEKINNCNIDISYKSPHNENPTDLGTIVTIDIRYNNKSTSHYGRTS